MKNGSIVVALLTLVGGGSAWAQGVAAGGTAGGGTGGAVARGASPGVNTTSTSANSAVARAAMTPPPPASLTTPPSASGVPPTPAPASPGLPSPPMAGFLPSQQGFDAQTANQLRPSRSLNINQTLNVQSALAAAGFFRGPIDGNMTASTRAAIRQFQDDNRLPATGELDAETINLLARTTAAGAAGANGVTSTSGNRAAAGDPFANTFTGVPQSFVTPGTPVATPPNGPIFSTPFPISTPLNTSPVPPQGTTIQP